MGWSRRLQKTIIDFPQIKRCSKCKQFKSIDNFYPAAHHRDGLTSQCKDCLSIKNLERTKEKRRIKNENKLCKDCHRKKVIVSKRGHYLPYCQDCIDFHRTVKFEINKSLNYIIHPSERNVAGHYLCEECKRKWVIGKTKFNQIGIYCDDCSAFHKELTRILHDEERKTLSWVYSSKHKNKLNGIRNTSYANVKCDECGKEFFRARVGNKWGIHLCSRECASLRLLKKQQEQELKRLDKKEQKINSYLRRNKKRNGYMIPAEHWKQQIDLTPEDMRDLIDKPCYYSGRLGDPIKGNGIDRIDSMKGYVKGNVVTCDKDVNFAKRQLSQKEFARLIVDCYPWAISFLTGDIKCEDVLIVEDGSKTNEQ
jgi:uncharacterized Zn finger protein